MLTSLAYCLLNCDEGSEKRVLDEIKNIDEVKETQETFGPFGAVIKVESNSLKEVKEVLNEKIRCLNGVRSSITLVEYARYSEEESQPRWEEVRGLSWIFYED